MASLTPCEAFDYKWKTSVNSQGGIGKHIPDDIKKTTRLLLPTHKNHSYYQVGNNRPG